MKTNILITKVGSVFYTRELAAKGSKVGEQGETEGIINHLLKRDDIQLIYFGQWRGKIPDGMIYVEAFIDGLNEKSSSDYQEDCWRYDYERLKVYNPKFFIQVAGYASCNSTINNPVGAAVQAAGVRYVAPLLSALERLKLPRIIINNDPRSYPRESEFAWGWDWCRPRALLSQRTRNWPRRMRDKRYECREVYAGAENWCEHIQLLQEKSLPITAVSHAHIGDGCRFKERDNSWSTILSPQEDVEVLYNMGMRVYGKGWEHFQGYDSKLMPGAIRPNEVMEILAKSKVCPVVAAGDNFYTGKLRTCLAQGCLPLFYGNGQPHTFDPFGKYIPLNESMRITEAGDLLKAVRGFDKHEACRAYWVERLWRASMPDWSMLDKCVDDCLNDRNMNTESWFEEYGGYRAIT